MFRLSTADMIGHTVHDFMPAREARHVTRDLKRVLQGETVIVQDYRPNGGTSSYLVINQRVEDDEGIPIGISVTAIDVSDRKSIESALNKTEEKRMLTRELKRALEELGFPLLKTQIPTREAYKQAMALGQTVLQMNDRGAKLAAAEIRACADEIVAMLP